jgi:hypothetical protein
MVKSDEFVREVKLERTDGNFIISRNQNEISLVEIKSSNKHEVLVLDEKEMYSCDNPNWLFKRVY